MRQTRKEEHIDFWPTRPNDPGQIVSGKGTLKDPWVITHGTRMGNHLGWWNEDGTYQESENV